MINEKFRLFAQRISQIAGRPLTFLLAVVVIVTWGFSGTLFNYSDTWQLVINTSTTIITFLMVFIIQNTQNRDAKSIQLKLDELIRSTKTARNSMLDLENLTDDEIDILSAEFQELYQKEMRRRGRIKNGSV
ncbi:MAG: low affinity iron permease family protein [Candidatus Roizmanbacteria bacterium]|nr:low affinity iron permease family protein [Candidatus Roizmanbacteria bacterium]